MTPALDQKPKYQKIQNIALECKRPELAKRSMMTEMKTRLTKNKAEQQLQLLRQLNRNKLCLTSTEQLCSKLCRNFTNKGREIAEKVMRWKMRDAYRKYNKCCDNMNQAKKECDKILKDEHISIKFRAKAVMLAEVRKEKEYLKKKMRRKVIFLKEKRRIQIEKDREEQTNREKEDDIIEGIRIYDMPITQEFDSKPKCYGGVQLKKNEYHILSLPPKFALYEEVNIDRCEAEIEKGMAKLRWNRRKEEEKEKREREWAYDSERNTMNFRNLRPTEMRYNKRVFLPSKMAEEEEIKVMNLKNEMMKKIQNYCEQEKDVMKMSNLKQSEIKGLKSIKTKMKNNLVVSQTDKSGKFSVDTKDNYVECMKVHIDNDEEITEEDHLRVQKEANAHSTFWVKILGVSKDTGEGEKQRERNHQRAKNNLMVEGSELPPVYGLRKDHKKTNDEIKGPPLRPVCSATTAYNSKLANLINEYLARIWKNERENCASTEDLLSDFDKLNEKGLKGDYFIGSADVVALYPSLDIELVAEVVKEMIIKSEVTIEGVDYEEVGLYIAVSYEKEELEKAGIQDMCPKRKQKQGRKPTMTGQAVSNATAREKVWQPAQKKPETKKEKVLLIAEAVRIVLRFLLKNHLYCFEESRRRQKNGGPIGLVLTDAVAKIYMTWWDRKVKEKAGQEGMEIVLYRRYVDDINIIAKMNTNTEQPRTKGEIEKQGMELFQKIGNGIHKSIKLEIDHPGRHDDEKMPLLDVKVWLEEQENTYQDGRGTESKENSTARKTVMYEHYRKEIASRMTVHERSAIPHNMKRNILTQEVIRILKNCSPTLEWKKKAEHIEAFSMRMQFSGYPKKFRKEVVKSGLKAYKQMERNDKEGKIPLHRSREWKKKGRERKKRKQKEDWFRKNEYHECPIFIPATPGGKLKKELQKKVNESDIKIKIVEKTGYTLKRILQKTSITQKKECGDVECMICRTSDRKGLCRKEGVTYEIQCRECNDKYIGETGRNGHARTREHMNEYKMKKESSVMWRHCVEKHDSNEQEFKFKIRQVFGEDTTLRQVTEAIEIRREGSINNKMEWGHTDLPRLAIE